MPNWCITNYAITGDTRDIRSLYRKMKNLQDRPESLLPNGFGKTWLGNLVKRLGGNPNSISCRGEWMNLSLRDANTLLFDTESAWSRAEEVEQIISNNYDVSIWFLSEEFGCGIFETNDEDGTFFPEQFIIDRPVHDGCEYYTEEAFLQKMSEIAGETVGSFTEAAEWAEKHNEDPTRERDEDYVYVYQAEQPNY